MPLFTIFTPTYNRAYTLPQLYKSLINQTLKDFVWLIIDDGSTDDTEQIIKSFIEEKKISITYIKQQNQGKHIAINNSLDIITTEYFITVDSDDYLLKNAVQICTQLAEENIQKEKFAGFTFFRSDKTNKTIINSNNKTSFIYNYLIIDLIGENTFVLKTNIAKKYKFPVYVGEKFCQESYMLVQIMNFYNILYTDYILAIGEYLEDGLSQNIYKRLLANPKYSLATLKIKYESNIFNKEEKKTFAINYWDIVLKTKVVNPIIQIFNFPLMGTLIYLTYRIKSYISPN